jgi:D-aspartate ligase
MKMRREKSCDLENQPFIPVILGANIGVYSIARSFHEAYGVKSISVCRKPTGPIKHSVLIQEVIEPSMEEESELLSCLDRIAESCQGTPKILIGSADWHVERIAGIRDRLGNEWIIPYATRDILERLTNKEKFYRLCEDLQVDFPKYITVDGETADVADLPFDYPVVIKPAKSASYQALSFAGKKKVFTARNKWELENVLLLIRGAGYPERLIIQEFVPGDDTCMHILTLYTAQDGETKLASFGQTLLEDHTPGGIGNPVAIRTFRNDEVVRQAKMLVEHAGFVGFSNFDLKYDWRDGKYKFFELNARLGRSNFYVTAEGHNPAQYYVKDYLEQQLMPFSMAKNEILYSVVPKRLLLKNIRQEALADRVKTLYKSGLTKNPLHYFPVERSIRRFLYVVASTYNYYKKFKKYPPVIMEKDVFRSDEEMLWDHRGIGAEGDR